MVGWAVYLLPYALLFQMLVTYPEGRARTWTERGLSLRVGKRPRRK